MPYRRGMRNVGFAVAVLAVLSFGAAELRANVYASGLNINQTEFQPSLGQTVEIGYILNENADDNVMIEVMDASMAVVRTVNLGPQGKGAQSWVWDGKDDANTVVPDGNYTVQITASDDGHSDWDVLNDIGDPVNTFFFSRGMDVNTNLMSPNLGRIYVAENGGATVAGRVTSDGIYILNADHTDAIGQGDTAQTGGVDWSLVSLASPHTVRIAPDDDVFVCDWSDTHSGLWVGDPDFSVAVNQLANEGRTGTGWCENHGSVASVWIEGTGENRVVYTVDEDWDDNIDPAAPAGINTRHRGSILKYPVGTATNYADPPEIVYDDNPALVLNGDMGMFRDSNGEWYVSQYRYSGTCPSALNSLFKVSADGTTVLFRSVVDLCNQFDSYGGVILADPFTRTRAAIAIDEARDRLYGSGANGVGGPTIIQWSTLAPNTVEYPFFASSIRTMSVDVAGNLYATDTSDELLYQWSPPDGANAFTTPGWFTIQVGEAVVPTAIEAGIARTGANEVEVSWTGAAAGKTQTVESRDTVGSGEWADVGSGSGETGSVMDDVTGVAKREYRVREE